jgi:DUF971 family protein
VLQVGKREVGIDAIEPVGHYGVQPRFTDGHETGIFGWEYLHWLGTHQTRLWKDYLDRLKAAHASRDPAPAPSALPNETGVNATALSRPRG